MNQEIILDCTLRDGGYVNHWSFDTKTARNIMDSLYQSGIRCVEIGMMGTGGEAGKSTLFSSFHEMEPLLLERKSDCRYAVMVTQAQADRFPVPKRTGQTVDMIRIAYFKNEFADACKYADRCLQKGYEVFLQPMATFMYDETELAHMIRQINAIRPHAVYMVDSFSNLYPKDIRKMADGILEHLDGKIGFGFHAHNNMQLAFANAMEFLESDTGRCLYVDGSIYGMGRGAGNVPVELLMEYCNKKGSSYDIQAVLSAYQHYIKPVFEQYFWGYAHAYYLTASKDMNSVYSWYFMNHGITDVEHLAWALEHVKDKDKYTLIKEEAEKIVMEVKEMEKMKA